MSTKSRLRNAAHPIVRERLRKVMYHLWYTWHPDRYMEHGSADRMLDELVNLFWSDTPDEDTTSDPGSPDPTG